MVMEYGVMAMGMLMQAWVFVWAFLWEIYSPVYEYGIGNMRYGKFGLPCSMVLLAHIVHTVGSLRNSSSTFPSSKPLPALIACFVATMGGSTLSAIITGQTPVWLLNDVTIMTILIVSTVLLYSPNDISFKLYNYTMPLFKVFAGIAWGLAVASGGVDFALAKCPHAFLLSCLCGVFSGCAGGILTDMFSLTSSSWSFKTPRALQIISNRLLGSILLTAVYHTISHFPHKLALISLLSTIFIHFPPLEYLQSPELPSKSKKRN